MAARLAIFAVFVLAAAVPAVGQEDGFLSIDCGLEAKDGGYSDAKTTINYVPDGAPYIDTGVSKKVSAEYENSTWDRSLNTLRSFPSGQRNCYALPTVAGGTYLVRLRFAYGNYDGKNSQSVQFDLHLGVNYWDKVYIGSNGNEYRSEAVFAAWASWAPVCLVNTNQGTPFVSSVELRELGILHYPAIMVNQSMYLYERRNMGPSSTDPIVRYPDDKYDRYWYPWETKDDPMYSNVSAPPTSTIWPSPSFAVPPLVLRTAVVPAGNKTVLSVKTTQDKPLRDYMVLLHFADVQDSQFRQFYVYSEDDSAPSDPFSPVYLSGLSLGSDSWFNSTDGKYSITLIATNVSKLPPILNAFEVYGRIALDNPRTFSKDFDAIMAIKLVYGIKKNWMNDPCFPTDFAWIGVKCSTASDNTTRIISLDLSSSNLRGSISNNFTSLSALEYLNLSGNQLNGPIPYSLCENNAGSFVFRFGYYSC